MPQLRNIFAVLVHEQPECVLDLVRNLHYLDPASPILLYNGGQNPELLHGLPLERYGAVAHPTPQLLVWGRLHDFALDCMHFGLDHLSFDTLTVVDSDQLGTRPNYGAYLARFLADKPNVGMLGSAPQPQPPTTRVGPAAAAWKEADLWRPWFRRFGSDDHTPFFWTFWPATVFTADAARELVQLFDTDEQLQLIMRRTTIWATEEVILPTLVARLGFAIAANPCSYAFVKYRVPYTVRQIEGALTRPDVFWVHPVARRYDDRLRRRVRAHHHQYEHSPRAGGAMTTSEAATPELLLTLPILNRMRAVEGWLEDDEADLLIGAAARALTALPTPHAIVEVGSYCGRSTVVLGSVVQALRPEAHVYAIDPHNGQVGALDQGISVGRPTLAAFQRNIAHAGLTAVVETIQQLSFEVNWERPISLLLIDGLHDYTNVARDFQHFERWIVPEGYVAFHDYADYYPGVQAFVNELLREGRYRRVLCVRSMMLVQKLSQPPAARDVHEQAGIVQPRPLALPAAHLSSGASRQAEPLVSCIMPTHNRRGFVPQAIRHFQAQTYANRELIVVDDGSDGVADLMPPLPHVRYIRQERRMTLGAKRNLACEAARGEIILHWDDDDWIAPWRIAYQVEQLLRERADLCGLNTLYFYEPAADRAWQYVYADAARPWLAGGTLCYSKTFWRSHRFPQINIGEDTRFVWSERGARLIALPNSQFYVALVHPANTSPKRITDQRWRSCSTSTVRELIGEDWSFYTGAAPQRPSALL